MFQPMWPWNLMDDLGKYQGTSYILCQVLCIISKPWVNSNWSQSPETHNAGQNGRFLCPAWPWNLMDNLENQQGTSSILCQTLCIVSKPWVNQNCTGISIFGLKLCICDDDNDNNNSTTTINDNDSDNNKNMNNKNNNNKTMITIISLT